VRNSSTDYAGYIASNCVVCSFETRRNYVGGYRCFETTCCLDFQGRCTFLHILINKTLWDTTSEAIANLSSNFTGLDVVCVVWGKETAEYCSVVAKVLLIEHDRWLPACYFVSD